MALKVDLAKPLLSYTLAVLLSLLGATWVMQLWNANLSIPFSYGGDAIAIETLVKCGIDNDWYLYNNFVGMPGGVDLRDYPLPDNLHLLFFKVLSLFTKNPFLIVNIYLLITFPLTTVTSLLVFRHLKLSVFPAIVASLLFAFIPYHFMRGIPHLLLSAYYLIPLAVMVCLWIYSATPPFFENSTSKWRPTFRPWRRNVLAIVICALVAAGGVYYAFFSSYLILISAVGGALRFRRTKHLISGMLLIAVITIGLVINLSPSLVYHWQKGANPAIANRLSSEAELYALKISQLLLPMTGHRIPVLAKMKNNYNQWSRANENDTSSLGTIGSIGFILLIFQLLFRKPTLDSKRLFQRLSVLNGAALLLGTLGGLGVLFSLLVSAQIRAYNRVSIFIAYFSLFAIAIVLDQLWRRWSTSMWKRGFMTVGFSALLVLAVLDQTSDYFVPPYQQIRVEFESDQKFVKAIEASMPEGAMVFQLPYVPFPENGAVLAMKDYDLFKGYLHSSKLRWSYGEVRGRDDDSWQRAVWSKPLRELVDTVAQSGFSGIYIDRNAFQKDSDSSMEKELSYLLNKSPLVSENGRLAFYSLVPYRQLPPAQVPETANREAGKAGALQPVLVNWKGGFSYFEGTDAENWRWCSNQGELHLTNTLSKPKKIRLEMTLQTAHANASQLKLNGDMFTESLTITSGGRRFLKELVLPPGDHIINFQSDAAPLNAPGDPRVLIFRVNNFRLLEVP